MRLRERIDAFLGRRPEPVLEAGPTTEQVKRALAEALDRKDTLEALLAARNDPDAKLPGNQNQSLFRALSGSTEDQGRDFKDSDRHKMLRLVHETYALRGVAHNLVEIALDFTIGDGFKPVANDPAETALQKVLDEVWQDHRNRLHETHEDKARTLFLEGERFMAADLSPVDGHLELGYLAPEIVKTVKMDSLGRDAFLELIPPDPGSEPRTYFVLDTLNEQIEIEHLPATTDKAERYEIVENIVGRTGAATTQRRQKVHGLAFAWFENRPDGAHRGRPDLLEVVDYIDIHDQLLWTDLEISRLLRMFIIDVSVEGLQSGADGNKKLEELGLTTAPKGPKVLCHNEKVVVQLLQGSIAKTASEKLEQIVALNIYGAKGYPEHFRGSGADTNLSTAQAQELIPMKRLRRKQDRLVARFHRLIEVSLELRRRAGALTIKGAFEFKIQRTEVGGKDKSRGATVLKDVTLAVTQLKDAGVISREAANAIAVQTIRDVGYELPDELSEMPEEDPSADLKKLEAALAGAGADPEKERQPRGARDAAA